MKRPEKITDRSKIDELIDSSGISVRKQYKISRLGQYGLYKDGIYVLSDGRIIEVYHQFSMKIAYIFDNEEHHDEYDYSTSIMDAVEKNLIS